MRPIGRDETMDRTHDIAGHLALAERDSNYVERVLERAASLRAEIQGRDEAPLPVKGG